MMGRKWKGTPGVKPCQQCGGEIRRGMNCFGRRKFCSNPCAILARTGTLEGCFWKKVDKNAPGGCWQWTASKKEKGYGQFLWQNKMHRAHRLAWTLSGRELPAKGLELAHSCDNRACVNPDHLRVATHAENMADCKARLRHTFGERTHHAKLTDAKAKEILAKKRATRRHDGYTKAIAAEYGVGVGAVNAIWRGDYWKHIQEGA